MLMFHVDLNAHNVPCTFIESTLWIALLASDLQVDAKNLRSRVLRRFKGVNCTMQADKDRAMSRWPSNVWPPCTARRGTLSQSIALSVFFFECLTDVRQLSYARTRYTQYCLWAVSYSPWVIARELQPVCYSLWVTGKGELFKRTLRAISPSDLSHYLQSEDRLRLMNSVDLHNAIGFIRFP